MKRVLVDWNELMDLGVWVVLGGGEERWRRCWRRESKGNDGGGGG